MKHLFCISIFGITLFLSAQSGYENQFASFLRSGKIDTEGSSETPSNFDRQGRDIRWRNTFRTGVQCPFYEEWRTKPAETDAPQSLTLKFKHALNPGTILAFAGDKTDTRFRLEGSDSSANGILVLPLMKEVGELKFTSTELHPLLIKNWGGRKELKTPLKTFQFSLHGLHSIPEKRINIAPFATSKVSGFAPLKQADAPFVSPAGLNDETTWKCWFSEKLKQGETAKAELSFPKPVTVRETVLYFGNKTYDFIPKDIRVTAVTENGTFEFGSLHGLKKETHNAQFFYLLKNPSPDRKITRLEFTFAPQKQIAAVAEILLLADPADNPGLQTEKTEKFEKTFVIPKENNTFADAVLLNRAGEQIRNLAPAKIQHDDFVFSWDGLDEAGKIVPPGTYQLKGAVHGKLTAEYDSTPYMPNPIPWVTTDRFGGWLSDHVPPSTIEFHKGTIWVGAPFAESGDTIMQLTADGKKLWGVRWLNLSGAWTIREQGGKIYVASGGGWLGNNLIVTELDPVTKEFKQILKTEVPKQMRQEKKNWMVRTFSGFAVTPEMFALSYSKVNRIDLYGKDGVKLRTIAIYAPGAMRFHNGKLYLFSGNKLIEYDLNANTKKEIISTGLNAPGDFTFRKNSIIVADTGAHQVKFFSLNGKLEKTIGKGTLRQPGKFNPLLLDSPVAATVDSKDQLWIAEFSQLPKRISVWDANGKFLRDYNGPGRYEAGCWLDPDDINTYYAEGMIFKRIREEWKLDSVYLDKGPLFVKAFLSGSIIPERPLKYKGKTYLASDRHYSPSVQWYGILEPSNTLKPHAAVGTYAKIITLFPQRPQNYSGNPEDYTFLWVNRNNDAGMQWNELQFLNRPFAKLQWSARMGKDLSFYWQNGKEIKKLSLKTGSDLPDYDLADAVTVKTLSPGEYLYAMAPLTDGQLLLNMKPLTCISETTGRTLWTYRNPFPSNTHDSPLPAPGDIQHTLNVEGEVSVPNFGKVFLLNGNKGVRYLFSGDGLYLGTLFADQRLAEPLSTSRISKGTDLSPYSLMDESFCGTFERGANGKVYFSGGKNHNSISEVKGLETLKRFSHEISFTKEEQKEAEASRIREIQKTKSALIEKPYVLKRIQGNNWNSIPEYSVFSNGKKFYSYRLASDGNSLKGIFRVYDSTPFLNNGNDWKMLFKTGDSINLEFASKHGNSPSDGDIRLLIAPYRNQTTVVAYRYKPDGERQKNATEFNSPIGKTIVDKVEILKNVQVKANRRTNEYSIEFSIPLAEIPPLKNNVFYYDAGVIFSDSTGTQNKFNLFHHSPVKSITADVPSEIRLSPQYMKEITN